MDKEFENSRLPECRQTVDSCRTSDTCWAAGSHQTAEIRRTFDTSRAAGSRSMTEYCNIAGIRQSAGSRPSAESRSMAERRCQEAFDALGKVWHVCTDENLPIIFASDEDFMAGISIFGLCAVMYSSSIRIITYQLMSNHIHAMIAGRREDVEAMFAEYTARQMAHLAASGRPLSDRFVPSFHPIDTLERARNSIAYINRNGYVVHPSAMPTTYPWGANRFYFDPERRRLHGMLMKKAPIKFAREITHSKKFDKVDAYVVEGYVSPLSFCHVDIGESLFRDARHYFAKISKNIESSREIANMIGESIYYTDNDLYTAVTEMCANTYKVKTPSSLTPEGKISIAKVLHYEYRSGNKQIARVLNLDIDIVNRIFPLSAR